MAWCYYCRRYTVNGRCPVCNRMYEEPNKRYDFYGKEIKEKPQPKRSSSSSSTYQSESSIYFWRGFFLGLGTNWGAIFIARKVNRKMMGGAITGAIVSTILIVHIASILIMSYLNAMGINISY